MKQTAVTIGADPEVFIKAIGGGIQPCVGVLDGTKDNPAPLPIPEGTGLPAPLREVTDQFRVQEDNVMAEFNIPPCTTYRQFDSAITAGLISLEKLLGTKKYKMSQKSTHEFTDSQLDSPQAQLIGCDPDMDAYTAGLTRMNAPAPDNSRTCGGHIHLGGKFNCPPFVVALLLELALAGAGALNKTYEPWYRRPGIYRPKPYGIEYRTLSNSWLWDRFLRQTIAATALKLGTQLQTMEAQVIQNNFRMMDWTAIQKMFRSGDTKSILNTVTNARERGYQL